MGVRSVAVACVTVALVVAGCDGGSPTPAASTPSPSADVGSSPSASPSPGETAACPNESVVVSDPAARLGGTLSGDVDGDGSPDEVSLAFDEGAEQGCQAFIVAELGAGETLHAPIERFDPLYGLPQPRLRSLAQVDDAGGKEIVADLAAGASTQFVGLFMVSDGAPTPILVEGNDLALPTDYLFPYGGSVGHFEASDCAEREGTVVVSSAVPQSSKAGDYELTRRFYTLDDATLTQEPSLTERHKSLSFGQVTRFPEFPASPFGSC